MDSVVRAVLLEVFGTQEVHKNFGWVTGEHNILFYADVGRLVGCNSIWVQTSLTSMVRMFYRVRL